jgi:hypothetical protein
MHQLNASLGKLLRNDMRSMHAKFYEFIMHIKGDIDLSLLSFSKFCRLNEQKLRITFYMKDVVLYEGILTKFISYFQSCILYDMDFQISQMDKYKT